VSEREASTWSGDRIGPNGLPERVVRACVSFGGGVLFGGGLVMVVFLLACVRPGSILLALVAGGALLSLARWPALVGAVALQLLLSDLDGPDLPPWVPGALVITWGSCRACAWAVHDHPR
jgi:hypothetical protein